MKNEKRIEIIAHILYGFILLGLWYLLNYLFFKYDSERQMMTIFRIVQYFLVYNSIRHFSRCFDEWKYYEVLFKIVEFPNVVYPLVLKPYSKMFVGLMLFLSVFFGGLYLALEHLPELIGHDLSYETKAFLGITVSTILIRAFGDWLIRSLVRWNYKTDNMKEHLELTSHLVNEERIRYGIYIIFFISILLVTFFTLENMNVFVHRKMGTAILSSFGAFIAFDRLFNNRNLIKFNPKKHWELLIRVYMKDSKYEGQENYLVRKWMSKNSSRNFENETKK